MLLLPFHAFISTWGGTTIGPLEAWKAWKEVLLSLLVIVAVAQSFRDHRMVKALWQSWITKLIVLYGVWFVVVSMLVGNQLKPLVVGLSIDLRLVTFLLISEIVFYYITPSRRVLTAIVLIPAGGVVVFGLLQRYILPYDFLSWFGYRANETIAPYNTIDQQLSQLRILSTLRGPNPLGAYLILPGLVLFGVSVHFLRQYRKSKARRDLWLCGVSVISFIALLTVLYGSQSRSAWLGFLVAFGLFVLLSVPAKIRKLLLVTGIIGFVVTGAGVYQLRHTSFVQNVILHDNPEIGPAKTSNSGHGEALKQGLDDIQDRPLLGCGPGCAGPASFYDPDGARLSENYFLQVGQEVGVVGLILFTAITALIARELYRQRVKPEALILLASLIGISVANLLLHVWADDTLAYVWWGVLGAVLVTQYKKPVVLKT